MTGFRARNASDVSAERCLILGYGNPARGDDGLGPAIISALEKAGPFPGVTLDSDYQLTVEDSWNIARHDVTVFVDADVSTEESFYFRRLESEPEISFSSHSVRAEVLLGMAESLFGRSVKGYLLGVRGYNFEMFTETLSLDAHANLEKATAFLRNLIETREFESAAQTSRKNPNTQQHACEGKT